MTDTDLPTDLSSTSDDLMTGRNDALRALAAENLETVVRLRGTEIPQHVGMAAACRRLAVEVPALLLAQVEADLRTGILATRWAEVLAAASERAGGDESSATTSAAIATLLREQSRAVMRQLAARGKGWETDAHRLEGEAAALERVAARLRQIAAPVPTEPDASAEAVTDDAAGTVG